MSDRVVLVALDRDTADRVQTALAKWAHGSKVGRFRLALRAALATDPDELERRIADAIEAEQTNAVSIHGADPDQLARAVISALAATTEEGSE